MTRSSSAFLLHRVSERVSAGAAAVALTFLMLLSVDTRANEPAGNPPSITVTYSDLAFFSADDTAKVYRKLSSAAREVCGMRHGAESLVEHIAQQDCFKKSLTEAVNKIDRPRLTALHAASARNVG